MALHDKSNCAATAGACRRCTYLRNFGAYISSRRDACRQFLIKSPPPPPKNTQVAPGKTTARNMKCSNNHSPTQPAALHISSRSIFGCIFWDATKVQAAV
ncbi:hypothetical protein PLESTM_001196900 [Pleodorina starrii]|nr:hypothetical protein PLESTM_001196900 [Pleodorina starrii]